MKALGIRQLGRRLLSSKESPKLLVGTRNEAVRDDWVRRQIGMLPPGGKLLDAGAGEQKYRRHCEHLKYVSQDFCEYDGKGDATGLQTGGWDTSSTDLVCDITSIPVENNSFDAVLCTEVLEHVPDPVAALEELNRVLRVGGVMLVTAPFCSLTHFSPYHYSSGFNRFWFQHHCERLGVAIEELSPNGNFFEYLAQELRRLDHCAKEFSATELTQTEKVVVGDTLLVLERLSAADTGSDSLLAFGFQVRCRKTR